MKIPHQRLESETLNNIIEEYVLREGTDYGHADISLKHKMDDVKRLLQAGEVILTYDETTKTCNIVMK